MHKLNLSPKYVPVSVIAFCLIFVGAGCTPKATTTPAATALIQTVEVTREVTRIVEVTATVTPAVTLQLATPPAASQEALPGLAGKWIDPDSSGGGTTSTIAWQNGTYVVTSVINSSRGGNELKNSSWSNGVLSWEYCPTTMQHCIFQTTVSINGDTLTVNWVWDGGGNSGTSDLQRQP